MNKNKMQHPSSRFAAPPPATEEFQHSGVQAAIVPSTPPPFWVPPVPRASNETSILFSPLTSPPPNENPFGKPTAGPPPPSSMAPPTMENNFNQKTGREALLEEIRTGGKPLRKTHVRETKPVRSNLPIGPMDGIRHVNQVDHDEDQRQSPVQDERIGLALALANCLKDIHPSENTNKNKSQQLSSRFAAPPPDTEEFQHSGVQVAIVASTPPPFWVPPVPRASNETSILFSPPTSPPPNENQFDKSTAGPPPPPPMAPPTMEKKFNQKTGRGALLEEIRTGGKPLRKTHLRETKPVRSNLPIGPMDGIRHVNQVEHDEDQRQSPIQDERIALALDLAKCLTCKHPPGRVYDDEDDDDDDEDDDDDDEDWSD